MFVKTTNGQIDKYPYSVGDLRRDNPNTSFPRVIPAATMASFGMYPVGYEAAPEYDQMTHRLAVSKMPVLKDGKWVLTKAAVALTEAEIAARAAAKAKEVREQRAELIAETDWMALSDNTLSPAWATYRQSLRDITTHANFPHLQEADWPVKPE
jgi:hypothetical protein